MIKSRKLSNSAMLAVTASPALTLPLGIGPWWADVAVVASAPIYSIWRNYKEKFYAYTRASGTKVTVVVKARPGFQIPKSVAKQYWYDDRYRDPDSYWSRNSTFDWPQYETGNDLIIALIDTEDEDADEKLHQAVASAKECIDHLLGRGSKAKQMADLGQKLLTEKR